MLLDLIHTHGMRDLLLALAATCEAEHARLINHREATGDHAQRVFSFQTNATLLRHIAARVY